MAKKVMTNIKLQIPAGQANPAPPVGPALGQHGLNIMDFCKMFNDKTKEQMGMIIPVVITVYQDHRIAPDFSAWHQEIAELKAPDLNSNDIEAAMRMVMGTARSMGIDVKG